MLLWIEEPATVGELPGQLGITPEEWAWWQIGGAWTIYVLDASYPLTVPAPGQGIWNLVGPYYEEHFPTGYAYDRPNVATVSRIVAWNRMQTLYQQWAIAGRSPIKVCGYEFVASRKEGEGNRNYYCYDPVNHSLTQLVRTNTPININCSPGYSKVVNPDGSFRCIPPPTGIRLPTTRAAAVYTPTRTATRAVYRPPTTVAGLGAIGLDPANNFHAKTVLAMWNRTVQPGVEQFPGYPQDYDLTYVGWVDRDARMLGNFVIWWNNPSNPPLHDWAQSTLPGPEFKLDYQQSDLTQAHLDALDTWATRSGVGLPSCIENCLAQAIGSISIANASSAQAADCIARCNGQITTPPPVRPQCPPGTFWNGTICESAAPPPQPPQPPPTQACPTGQVRNPSTGLCECPAGTIWDATENGCRTLPVSCPPGFAMTSTGCQPLPAPPPATAPTKASTSSNATAVLAALALLGVVGVIVNGAMSASREEE